MPDLRSRSEVPEIMDDLTLPEDDVRQALDEIELINKRLGGFNVITDALERIKWPVGPVHIMDLGCGSGGVLRAVSEWARQRRKQVRLVGVDFNEVMTRYAREKAVNDPGISFQTANVFDEQLMHDPPHIAMCSLFAHHFDGNDLISLVKQMHLLARRAVIINDLHRSPIAYHSIKILTALFGRSSMVKYDAPVSVARSLTRREWIEVMKAADIHRYSIRWRWAWRWQIIIEK